MERLDYFANYPEAFAKMTDIEALLRKTSLDKKLIHLVKTRASQLNGCAFCVDINVKKAKIDHERELRLYHLPVWQDSQLFSQKEKVALMWTEAVTRISPGSITDEIYAKVKEHFSDKELTELTMAIAMINMWNRFGAAFLSVPGSIDTSYGLSLDKAGL